MATFVLIHGGGHRGWHWHRLRPLLEARGHATLAPDIPMDDPQAGASAWAEAIVAAMADVAGRDDVVLVGHSLAGLALPIVAARARVHHLVFLCANLPQPGISYEAYLADHPDAVIVPPLTFDEEGRLLVSWEVAREVYYGDCEEEVARAAFERLVPSAGLLANRELCPLDAWPDVPATSIFCAEDRVIGPDWSRRASVERLGRPAIELPGGHSPFLSRPERLAAVLDGVAADLRGAGSPA